MATRQLADQAAAGVAAPGELLRKYLVQQQRLERQRHQQPAKIKFAPAAPNGPATRPESGQPGHDSIGQVQRKLLAFFYCYAILVVTMFLAYAVFCHQQQQWLARHRPPGPEPQAPVASGQLTAAAAADDAPQPAEQSGAQSAAAAAAASSSLENKLLVLERYIEVIALDLEDTKTRLREREKCACHLDCTFNGTRFADNQVWQSKCDTCSCRAGKISCAPRKCAPLNCDDQVRPAGQCCPVCRKTCKLPNGTPVRHGHTFKLSDSNATQSKQCTCQDGLIKCERVPLTAGQRQAKRAANAAANATKLEDKQQPSSNKTLSEYLKLISTTSATPGGSLAALAPPARRHA